MPNQCLTHSSHVLFPCVIPYTQNVNIYSEFCVYMCFCLFCLDFLQFKARLSSIQSLFLVLFLVITPGELSGLYGMAGIKFRSAMQKGSTLPSILLLWLKVTSFLFTLNMVIVLNHTAKIPVPFTSVLEYYFSCPHIA